MESFKPPEHIKLSEPIFNGHTYDNPLNFTTWKGIPDTFRFLMYKASLGMRKHEIIPLQSVLEKELPVTNPKFDLASKFSVTWLGHATLFLHMNGINFITDPSLWCGWAVFSQNHSFLYTGDTGFCEEEYRKIGEKFGGFDLAAIPIGCYCPRSIMSSQHIDPEEAVEIHKLVRAKRSIGIHWGTYDMDSSEEFLRPPGALQEAAQENGLLKREFFTIGHGQTVTYPFHTNDFVDFNGS